MTMPPAPTTTNRLGLPGHFLVPFFGLLLLLALAVYELLAPADRSLWVLVVGSTLLGVFVRPPLAAALGWILVLVLAAYLAINSALSPISGASWLTLLVIPWLPPLASNIVDYVRTLFNRVTRQDIMLDEQEHVHPATNLPGFAVAQRFLPILEASMRRHGHASSLLEIRTANLDVLASLHSPAELEEVQVGMVDAVRRSVRGTDWLFHGSDEALLLVADLGREVEPIHGQRVLIQKVYDALRRQPQIIPEIRALLLPDEVKPLSELLLELRATPPVADSGPTNAPPAVTRAALPSPFEAVRALYLPTSTPSVQDAQVDVER